MITFNKKLPKMKDQGYRESLELTADTYTLYLEMLKSIALSMFEWVNLPSSMNARYIERCLYYKGTAALLKDKEFGLINTGAVAKGFINIYGLPTEIECFSFSYNQSRLNYTGLIPKNEDEYKFCVLVMNTWERIPTCSMLELYSSRLAEVQRSCDANVANQKFPLLILTDDKQRFTLKQVYQKMTGNEPIIMADKNIMTDEAIKALKTDVPFVALDLKDYQRRLWNEALTFLGVSNLMDEKKERMIKAETNSNNEAINLMLQSYLQPRKEACKRFNELFGTNIDVKVRSDLENLVKMYDSSFSDLIGENKNGDLLD